MGVVRNSANPVWNYEAEFENFYPSLDTLMFTVWEHDPLSREKLGEVRLKLVENKDDDLNDDGVSSYFDDDDGEASLTLDRVNIGKNVNLEIDLTLDSIKVKNATLRVQVLYL